MALGHVSEIWPICHLKSYKVLFLLWKRIYIGEVHYFRILECFSCIIELNCCVHLSVVMILQFWGSAVGNTE